MTDAPKNPEPTMPTPTSTPPPRAFAQGTGVLLQTVGMIMFFCSCLICTFTPMWDKPMDSPIAIDQTMRENKPQSFSARAAFSSPAKAGYAFTVAFSTLGGLAIAGFGLGLQADRGRSAAGALATTIAVETVLLGAGVALWAGGAPLAMKALNLFVLLIYAVLIAFCIGAYRQVKATPPPANIEVVPAGKKIPYSFYHDDPPEVRLARDIAARQAKLDAEQKELDKMQRELDEKNKKRK